MDRMVETAPMRPYTPLLPTKYPPSITQNFTCFTPPVTNLPSYGLYSQLNTLFSSPLLFATMRLDAQS